MKSIKISMLALTLGLMSFTTINSKTTSEATISAPSSIIWKSEEIDLGNIEQNKPKTVIFEFKNTGKTAVVIKEVKPSCGCTTADYTKTPIQPGETAKVSAIFNAAAKGAFKKTVTVTTNAEETPKSLAFKGTVI